MDERIMQIAEHFGEVQILKTAEELAELSKELIKIKINLELKGQVGEYMELIDKIAEEVADVEIMLVQTKHILDLSDSNIEKIKEFKINRTLERIESGKY